MLYPEIISGNREATFQKLLEKAREAGKKILVQGHDPKAGAIRAIKYLEATELVAFRLTHGQTEFFDKCKVELADVAKDLLESACARHMRTKNIEVTRDAQEAMDLLATYILAANLPVDHYYVNGR